MQRRNVMVQVFVLSFMIVFFMFSGLSCDDSSNNKKNSNNDTPKVTDPFGFDVSDVEISLDDFAITASTNKTIGVVNDTFTLSAKLIGGTPNGDLTFKWSLPEGLEVPDGAAEGATIEVKASAEGEFLVEVIATDAAGNTVKSGVILNIYPAGQTYSWGDLGGDDGLLTQTDVDLLKNYLDGTGKLDIEQIHAADINLDNRIDETDLALIENAAQNGDPAPVYVSLTSASMGNSVLVIHPALLDPSKDAHIEFAPNGTPQFDETCLSNLGDDEEASRFYSVRAKPGILTFGIPAKYACLNEDTTGVLKLIVGNDTDTQEIMLNDSFTISALPPIPSDAKPGELVIESMGRARMAIASLYDAGDAYADAIGATAEEKAIIIGSLKAASEMFDEQYGQFFVAWQKLDDSAKAMWERMARAQGLEDLVAQLKDASEELTYAHMMYRNQAVKAISADIGESLIKLICAFNKIADVSDKIAKINSKISSAMKYINNWFFRSLPMVGPVITFFANLSNLIGAVTDIIEMIKGFVPELGNISVIAQPAALLVGQVAKIAASIKIKIISGLCNLAAGNKIEELMDKLNNMLTKRIISSIPVASSYYRHVHFKRNKMGWVARKIYDLISWAAGKLLDATGIQEYMEKLAEKFCNLFGDPSMPIHTDFLKSSCGTLSNSKWTCTNDCAGNPPRTITISGTKDVCGDDKKGKTTLTCGGSSDGDIDYDYETDGDYEENIEIIEYEITETENESTGNMCGCHCGLDEQTLEYSCEAIPPGTTFEVVDGCEGWPDATQCSGWHSVVEGSAQDPDALYPDGTEMSAYDCTIKIHCPAQ